MFCLRACCPTRVIVYNVIWDRAWKVYFNLNFFMKNVQLVKIVFYINQLLSLCPSCVVFFLLLFKCLTSDLWTLRTHKLGLLWGDNCFITNGYVLGPSQNEPLPIRHYVKGTRIHRIVLTLDQLPLIQIQDTTFWAWTDGCPSYFIYIYLYI